MSESEAGLLAAAIIILPTIIVFGIAAIAARRDRRRDGV